MKVIDGKVKATLTELEVARKNLAAYERLAVETKKTDIHNLIVAELGELSNLALGNSENHYVNACWARIPTERHVCDRVR